MSLEVQYLTLRLSIAAMLTNSLICLDDLPVSRRYYWLSPSTVLLVWFDKVRRRAIVFNTPHSCCGNMYNLWALSGLEWTTNKSLPCSHRFIINFWKSGKIHVHCSHMYSITFKLNVLFKTTITPNRN